MEGKAKLTAYKNSANLYKILATAKLANFALDVVEIDNPQIVGKDVIENSPTNTYPILETSEGVISESSAIITYIGLKGGVAGSNDFERAQVAQWQFFSVQEVNYNKRDTIYPIFGFLPFDADAAKHSGEKLKNIFKTLNAHIAGKTFLVGNSLTIADIELFTNIKHFWQLHFVEQVRKNLYANIDAWFARVATHEVVVKTFGITHVCKVALKAPKVEKKEEPKKEAPKPVEKKEKKPENDDDEEPPKKKDTPAFPESKLDFDGFKKEFMNSKERKAVLDKFFEKEYDANAFSVYYVRYQKLASEGKVLFKTTNGRDGFLERIDQNRKYVFASHGVYGVEGDYDIRGVWLWRGKGIPFFLEEHPQFEYYERRELNPNVPEDRQVIDNYWLNLNEGAVVDGLAAVDVVTFK